MRSVILSAPWYWANARTIAWLVSDEARYVTAVALPVDAGFTAK